MPRICRYYDIGYETVARVGTKRNDGANNVRHPSGIKPLFAYIWRGYLIDSYGKVADPGLNM